MAVLPFAGAFAVVTPVRVAPPFAGGPACVVVVGLLCVAAPAVAPPPPDGLDGAA